MLFLTGDLSPLKPQFLLVISGHDGSPGSRTFHSSNPLRRGHSLSQTDWRMARWWETQSCQCRRKPPTRSTTRWPHDPVTCEAPPRNTDMKAWQAKEWEASGADGFSNTNSQQVTKQAFKKPQSRIPQHSAPNVSASAGLTWQSAQGHSDVAQVSTKYNFLWNKLRIFRYPSTNWMKSVKLRLQIGRCWCYLAWLILWGTWMYAI